MNKHVIIAIGLWFAFLIFGCTAMRERAFQIISTPDNPVEEIAEEIIEAKTGWDIDLSYDTPED